MTTEETLLILDEHAKENKSYNHGQTQKKFCYICGFRTTHKQHGRRWVCLACE